MEEAGSQGLFEGRKERAREPRGWKMCSWGEGREGRRWRSGEGVLDKQRAVVEDGGGGGRKNEVIFEAKGRG